MARVKPVSQLMADKFDDLFPNEDACKEYLVKRRWPEGVICPRCDNPDVYPVTNRPFHWQSHAPRLADIVSLSWLAPFSRTPTSRCATSSRSFT